MGQRLQARSRPRPQGGKPFPCRVEVPFPFVEHGAGLSGRLGSVPAGPGGAGRLSDRRGSPATSGRRQLR